jgi:hypothetical protein
MSSHSEGSGQRVNSSFTITGAANVTEYTTNQAHGLNVNDIVCYGSTFARVTSVPETNVFTVNVSLSNEEISG